MRVAFCVCYWLNDKYPSRNFNIRNNVAIRDGLDIINQIYVLYKSIKLHIHNVDYDFYVFTKNKYLTKDIKNIFNHLNIKIIILEDDIIEKYFRPKIYTYDIVCDYKCVMDCDIIFVNDFSIEDIEYMQNYDCLGMYGHRNIDYQTYMRICNKLNLKIPTEIEETKYYKSNNKSWTVLNTYQYNLNITSSEHINDNIKYKNYIKDTKRLFPYFNNGMILIKNTLSKELGNLWLIKRKELHENFSWLSLGDAGEA